MFNWKRYFCCFINIYNEYEMNKVRKIYNECFTEENDFDPSHN